MDAPPWATKSQAADKFVAAIEGITSTKKRVLQRSVTGTDGYRPTDHHCGYRSN